MITIRRVYSAYYHRRLFDWRRWRYWSIVRIGQGFEIWTPFIMIRVGHSCPPCRECGRRDSVSGWPEDNPGATICTACCTHPDYQRYDGDWWCIECGEPAPYDWIRDHTSE